MGSHWVVLCRMSRPDIFLKDYSGWLVGNRSWAKESAVGGEMPVGIIATIQRNKIMPWIRFVGMVVVECGPFWGYILREKTT